MALDEIYPQAVPSRYRVQTEADGPAGRLPLTGDDLRTQPSGNLFGKTMNAGMGWNPDELNNDEFMIISNQYRDHIFLPKFQFFCYITQNSLEITS